MEGLKNLCTLYAQTQAVSSVVTTLRDADLNLNPIPEKNIIKVPLPK